MAEGEKVTWKTVTESAYRFIRNNTQKVIQLGLLEAFKEGHEIEILS